MRADELMPRRYEQDLAIIETLIRDYFIGLHQGDVERLARIFHPDVVLKAPGVRRSRQEWLDLVANRPVPEQEGHPYDYRILGIELVGDQAMVKVHCPLLGHTFLDYLGLLRENGRWLIVNKMYADY